MVSVLDLDNAVLVGRDTRTGLRKQPGTCRPCPIVQPPCGDGTRHGTEPRGLLTRRHRTASIVSLLTISNVVRLDGQTLASAWRSNRLVPLQRRLVEPSPIHLRIGANQT